MVRRSRSHWWTNLHYGQFRQIANFVPFFFQKLRVAQKDDFFQVLVLDFTRPQGQDEVLETDRGVFRSGQDKNDDVVAEGLLGSFASVLQLAKLQWLPDLEVLWVGRTNKTDL
jgi:hypothetical protein